MSGRDERVILSCRDVSLTYTDGRGFRRTRSTRALDSVSFDLHGGQTLGIVGRNGAGKSSLLRLMAGIMEPDSGTVNRAPNLRISLLTLQLGFDQRLTGRENALLGCLLMGVGRDEAEQLLPEIIEFSGLEERIDDRLGAYSSGMRARLGFSVAFFTRADVMLIDEVLGVGDHEFRIKSREALLTAIASDRTAVVVSHDEHFLADVCDSLLWLEGGRLAMHGLPELVLKKYHDYDHLVATFAHDRGWTLEQTRNHPDRRDPLEAMALMEASLARYWDRGQPGEGNSESVVRTFHPGRFPRLSQVVHQPCGRSQWIEQLRVVAESDRDSIEALYDRHENLLLGLAKLAKTDPRQMRTSRIARDMLELFVAR